MILDMPLTGEDAPPVEDDRFVIVCDGMGSASQEFCVEGEVHTQAYFASRAVIDIAKDFIDERYEDIMSSFEGDLSEIARDMADAIEISLNEYAVKNGINMDSLNVRGDVVRLLPTTLAACVFREDVDHVDVVCLWAGDSRCYSLDSANGLRQLSKDDSITDGDAMDDLLSDSPMSNFISLSHEFHINWCTHRVPKPCIVFSASDGCFAYLGSPMELELIMTPPSDAVEFDLVASMERGLEHRPFDDRTFAGRMFGMAEPDMPRLFGERHDSLASVLEPGFAAIREYDETRAERRRIRALEMTPENIADLTAAKDRVRTAEREKNRIMTEIWAGSFKETYRAKPLSSGTSSVVETVPVTPITAPVTSVVEPTPPEMPDPPTMPEPMDPEFIVSVDDDMRTDLAGVSIKNHRVVGQWGIVDGYLVAKAVRYKNDESEYILYARPEQPCDTFQDRDLRKVLKHIRSGCVDPIMVELKSGYTIIRYNIHREGSPVEAGSDEMLRMFLKLAQTLQGIHQRSVTHNSVCPANVCIYVGKDGYGCSLRGWHTARHCDRSDDEFEKGVMRDLFGLATVMSSLAPWDAGIMALSEDVLHGRCTTDNDLIKRMKEMRRV